MTLARLLFLSLLSVSAATVTHSQCRVASGADPAIDRLKALELIELRAQRVIEKAIPTIVGVGDEGHGSGVIVTPEGLILSQAHVSHGVNKRPFNSHQPLAPGRQITVILHDGTRRKAELLGFDAEYDISKLHLTEPGPYPHAPLVTDATVALGDWVIKLGHPGGYSDGRSPVSRLGRVLATSPDSFTSDCLVQGGDSGGPYFDLNGRVVGIIRSMQVPKMVAASSGAFLESAGVPCFSVTSIAIIESRMEAMLQSELRLAKVGIADQNRLDINEPILPAQDWKNGETSLANCSFTQSGIAKSVVRIFDKDLPVAYGTVVEENGLVLAIASRLPSHPLCQLSDGRKVTAEPVGMVPAFDLAFLRLSSGELLPIEWTSNNSPSAGTILRASGLGSKPLATGIVSVKRRFSSGLFPTEVPAYRNTDRRPAALLPILGNTVSKRGYWVEYSEGAAAEAGIRPGDVLVKVDSSTVQSHQDLAACVNGRFGGDRVEVEVLRGQTRESLTAVLRSDGPPTGIIGLPRLNLPVFFEHDLPLREDECGGPVIGLDGKAYGITITRAAAQGCIAVPADTILGLALEFKGGKYKYAAPPASTPEFATNPSIPVSLTVGELATKMRERLSRFPTLMIQYDVTNEPRIDSQTLMSWNLLLTRDDTEIHKVAFDDKRRFAEVVKAGLAPYAVPPNTVGADPNSPPAIASIVERRKMDALARRDERDFTYLFARKGPQQSLRYLFDGEHCWVSYDAERSWSKTLPSLFESPSTYLAGAALGPLHSTGIARRTTYDLLCEEIDDNRKYAIRPYMEAVDNHRCIVLECETTLDRDGNAVSSLDVLWIDPALGYTPRRREHRLNNVLVTSWLNSSFQEFGKENWLPMKSLKTEYAPSWVAAEYQGQPAFDQRIVVTSVEVSNFSDELFRLE